MSLIENVFETERWEEYLDRATQKGINLRVIKDCCRADERTKMCALINNGKYKVFPPHEAQVPKDDGSMRTVYVNEPEDRILLSIVNDVLSEKYKHMIHPNCSSYQKGIGTQKVVKAINNELKVNNGNKIVKADFSKYFDSVKIECIEEIFNALEDDPIVDMLWDYYHTDIYFDLDKKAREKYMSLRQGCACAAFLANVVLYELDEFMSKKYPIYHRYSDDTLIITDNPDEAINDMNNIIGKYGLTLNPKKVNVYDKGEQFVFLGFTFKSNGKLGLSPRRVKNLNEMVKARTVDSNRNGEQATKAIVKLLFGGEHSYAGSFLTTIDDPKDMYLMNECIMDHIRACYTGKKKLGGMGWNNGNIDYVPRGNTGANFKKVPYIKGYYSLGCMRNAMLFGSVDALIREMQI